MRDIQNYIQRLTNANELANSWFKIRGEEIQNEY